jgi:hypothetical protein
VLAPEVTRLRKPIFKSETVIFYRPGTCRDAPQTDVLRRWAPSSRRGLRAVEPEEDDRRDTPDAVDKRGYSDAVRAVPQEHDFKARLNDTFAISFQG